MRGGHRPLDFCFAIEFFEKKITHGSVFRVNESNGDDEKSLYLRILPHCVTLNMMYLLSVHQVGKIYTAKELRKVISKMCDLDFRGQMFEAQMSESQVRSILQFLCNSNTGTGAEFNCGWRGLPDPGIQRVVPNPSCYGEEEHPTTKNSVLHCHG